MKTPWHIWVVGIVGALWVAGGCYDYIMTATQNEAYYANFSDEIRDFFFNLPGWYMALYAIAVWGGLLGCILLLLRKHLAAIVLLFSFVCTAISFVWYLFMAEGAPAPDGAQWAMTTAILVVSAFLVWYSRKMSRAGVLT